MSSQVPDLLPVLSRGKHRRPKQGACFMEMASVLAGETWSDHPACTHPVLGELARLVNDNSSDRHRSELAVLVPTVVGLSPAHPDVRWTLGLTAAAASYAVLRVPRHTQRALAAGLLTVQRVMQDRGLHDVPGTDGIGIALSEVPDEVRFARRLSDGRVVSDRVLQGRVAPAVARSAVMGLANGHQANPDRALRELLETVIEVAQRLEADDRGRARPTQRRSSARASRTE